MKIGPWSLSNFHLFTFGETVPTAVVGYSPEVGVSCILLTVTVKGSYLSYGRFPVSLSQSSHSPVTFDLTKAFLQAGLLLIGCFFFFFLYHPE